MGTQIKSGAIGAIVGMVVAFATVFITTGSYKEKIDTNYVTIKNHEIRLDAHDNQITGIQHDAENLEDLVTEVRADIKTLLKRTE